MQTDSEPAEEYMVDGLDDMLIKAAQEVAVEKPVEDEVVEDVVVEDEVIEDETVEELPSVTDASMQTEADEEDLHALEVDAETAGGANLPITCLFR